MELAAPLNVHWELTNICNLHCVHCYQQDDPDSGPLPSSEVLDTIARRIVDASVFEVTITGGEPLLVPQLRDLIRLFNGHGVRPHVTSNGMLVSEEVADWLASVDVTFQVSLDAADPDVHNQVRGSKRAFQAATAGIRRLVRRGVEVSIAYCAMRPNLDQIGGVAELADELGVRRVCVGEVLPYFGSAARRTELAPDSSGYADFVAGLTALKERYAPRVEVAVALLSGHLHDPRLRAAPCTALARDLAVLHDGWAYPCPFVRSPAYRLGNLLEQSIADVWDGEVARRFREERAAGAPKHCTTHGSPSDPIPLPLLPRRPR